MQEEYTDENRPCYLNSTFDRNATSPDGDWLIYKVPLTEYNFQHSLITYLIAIMMISILIIVYYFLFTLTKAFEDTDEYEEQMFYNQRIREELRARGGD